MLNVLRRSPLFDALARRPPVVYARARRALEAVDAMSAGQREEMQARLLRRVLADAGQTRAYSGLPLGRLDAAPVLRKGNVRGGEDLFARSSGLPQAAAATGGTTGTPLRLLRSPGQIIFEQALVDHLVAQAGGPAGAGRVVVLRGDAIKPVDEASPPFWRATAPDRMLLSAHHLTPANYPHYEAFLASFRPHVLHAYPSALELLTRFAEDAGGGPRIGLVFTSSEQLPAGLRARVKRAFGADLIDFYGQAERVCAAWSLRDGEYWFRPDYGVAEMLAEDDGLHLLGTSLRNRAQILLRYDTGDLVDLGRDDTPERRRLVRLGLAAFGGITGRQSEYIALPDGSRIIGLNHVPRGAEGAASVQILQIGPNRIRVHVTPATGYGDHTRATVLANLRQKAPSSIEVDYVTARQPVRLPNGKAPLFIDARGRPELLAGTERALA